MIKKLQQEIHENAINKGWYDEPTSSLEVHALIHSEVSEATECVRNDEWPIWYKKPDGFMIKTDIKEMIPEGSEPKGEAVEFADVIMRILDYAESKKWNMEEIIQLKLDYNKTRPYRHGGKVK